MSKFLAEFIGTFALVFFGCGAAMMVERVGAPAASVPIVFGVTIATMIYAVGHISGAHFNPAVTLAFAVVKRFPKGELVMYWAAQFLGAIVAITTLHLLLPSGVGYGATTLYMGVGGGISQGQAFALETLLTFFLMFVIISVATDSRAVGTMAGFAIGSTVMLAAAVMGPLTGASMNPARTFAPNIFQGEYADLWIYMTAPLLGAVLGAIVYEKIRCEAGQSEGDGSGCC